MARKGGNNPKREPVGDVAARLALPGRPSSRSPRPSQLTPTGLPGTGQPWRSTVGGDGNGRCPACDGSGWVERRDEYQGLPHVTMVPCPDPAGVHRAAEVARLARISGLLPEELALRLDDVVGRGGDTSKMVALARRFVEEPWGFLTLWGGYGNGKTLILQAVVNEFRERHGIVGTYVRMHDLIEYVRAGYAADARDDARARYERLKALPVLAIDEFEAAQKILAALLRLANLALQRLLDFLQFFALFPGDFDRIPEALAVGDAELEIVFDLRARVLPPGDPKGIALLREKVLRAENFFALAPKRIGKTRAFAFFRTQLVGVVFGCAARLCDLTIERLDFFENEVDVVLERGSVLQAASGLVPRCADVGKKIAGAKNKQRKPQDRRNSIQELLQHLFSLQRFLHGSSTWLI